MRFLAVLALAMLPAVASAAGKKPTPDDGSTGLATPSPVRKVLLKTIATKPFPLPNGKTVDLTADLDSILISAVTGTTAFSPSDPGGAEECETHIEIRSALTAVDMDAGGGKISFGYSPSGTQSPVTDAHGTLDVKVSTITMDFSVWSCVNGQCSAVAAANSTQAAAGVSLDFSINIDEVETGTHLVFNSPLAGIFRNIMKKAFKDLGASDRLSELPWYATVLEADPAAGTLFFNAGTEQRLDVKQAFAAYAVDSNVGICSAYKPIAYVHTTRVDARSSLAAVAAVLEQRPIQKGDIILVRKVAPPKK